ncbi:MAG: sugar ABC transporter permease [Rhodospirillales bacterium]|nr:sugar ABC transporter permease [Rhodospirillales bacterium]
MNLLPAALPSVGIVPARAGVARRARPHGKDLVWSIAFLVPYAVLLLGFAAWPIFYALRMGVDPALYRDLLADPRYMTAALNTAIFVAVAVNAQMLLALGLSGFFARARRWIKALFVVFLLPWTLPAVPAYLSFHWLLVTDRMGLLDQLIERVLHLPGPFWFAHGWSALACDIAASVWKWTPLWTLILLGGRMAIPRELTEAAIVDGASPGQIFRHVTLPLLANLYLVSTLIAAIWAFGDYAPVLFVSGGGPAFGSDVISLMGFHIAFDLARPELGVAAGLAVLPAMVALIAALFIALRRTEAQL